MHAEDELGRQVLWSLVVVQSVVRALVCSEATVVMLKISQRSLWKGCESDELLVSQAAGWRALRRGDP